MWLQRHKYPEWGEDGQGEVISSDKESPERTSITCLEMITRVKVDREQENWGGGSVVSCWEVGEGAGQD